MAKQDKSAGDQNKAKEPVGAKELKVIEMSRMSAGKNGKKGVHPFSIEHAVALLKRQGVNSKGWVIETEGYKFDGNEIIKG